jgi:hypothetical protein
VYLLSQAEELLEMLRGKMWTADRTVHMCTADRTVHMCTADRTVHMCTADRTVHSELEQRVDILHLHHIN